MPEKREDSYQTTSIAWKKMAAKIINVEEYISMSMCKKKKKLIANNFKRIVMIPLNVNSIFKTNISNNYHVPLKYFNVLIAITKSGFFSK